MDTEIFSIHADFIYWFILVKTVSMNLCDTCTQLIAKTKEYLRTPTSLWTSISFGMKKLGLTGKASFVKMNLKAQNLLIQDT